VLASASPPQMPSLSLSSAMGLSDDLVPLTDRRRDVSSATKDGPSSRSDSSRSTESQKERLAQRRQ